ncbi:MAG TPA: hypothetical protein VEA58_14185, partial [Anaerovoracaceae bacterium]|nr:hypothetical protein [Anaerovoracaceae bacterium]
SIFNQLSGGKIGKEVLALIYYNYYKFKKGDSTIEQDKVQELLQKLECDEKDASYLLGIGVPFWPLFKANLEKPFGKIVEEKVEEKGFKERLDEIINSL